MAGSSPDRPRLSGSGTEIDPVPVAGFAENFSPIPRIAPPPFGREMDGAWEALATPVSACPERFSGSTIVSRVLQDRCALVPVCASKR